jgi:hypothetical protein
VAAFHKKSRPERDQISPCSEAPEDRAIPLPDLPLLAESSKHWVRPISPCELLVIKPSQAGYLVGPKTSLGGQFIGLIGGLAFLPIEGK